MRAGLIFLLVLGLATVCVAQDAEVMPPYYLEHETWHDTLLSSREALLRMEDAGELGISLPDLGASDFTLSVWVKTTIETGSIIAKGPSWRRRGGRRGGSAPQSKVLYLWEGAVAYEVSDLRYYESNVKVNDGAWHHVALTGQSPLVFYVDGKEVKRFEIEDMERFRPDDDSQMFMLGIPPRSMDYAGNFQGSYDELRIYARALDSAEVAGLASGSKAAVEGLAGWWPFEKQGTDASGNENTARIFRARSSLGRVGNGLTIEDRGGVMLPASRDSVRREELWEEIAERFGSAAAREQMRQEQEDGIWQANWQAGSFGELARRYAKATPAFAGLDEKAQKMASLARDRAGLQTVRETYHSAIANKKAFDDLQGRIEPIRQAMAFMGETYTAYANTNAYAAQLATLRERLADLAENPLGLEAIKALGQDFHGLQYEALFENNPLIDFDKIVFIKRYTYQSSHYYTDFIDGCVNFGGNLCILNLRDGSVTDLLPQLSTGIFGRFDLSFDAQNIVFDWKPNVEEGFRIYEVGIDGNGLRQLTFAPPDEEERIRLYDNSFLGGTGTRYNHHTDDMHPCYLPDGGICFSSTRCEYGTLCDSPDILSTAVLYRMDGDGSNLHKLTNSAVSEFSPALTHDGRILYSRWEYVDKGQIGVKCLWAMRPDGTGSVEIYGNDIPYPPVMIHGRPIPGFNNKFVFLGTPHYPQSGVGTVIRVDINHPIRTKEPMTYITPHLDIRTEGGFHHKVDGEWVQNLYGPLYMDPYPLSEKFYLVSHNPDKIWNDVRAYGLYLLDEFGNHVRFYQDPEFSAWQPIPLRARVRPSVLPPMYDMALEAPKTATVAMSDVYEGLDGVERGTIKWLRVMEQVPRPWGARRFWDQKGEYGGHTALVSMRTVLGLKVLHGVVPVHDDGSAHFIVPADKNIYFEALDENYMEVQRERTYINFRPGEQRTCIGCHTYRRVAPSNKTFKALSQPPSAILPQPGDTGPRAIHYPRDVQPVWDKHCVDCHGNEEPAGGISLTGDLTSLFSRSYEAIIRAGLVVTTNEGSDFDGTEALPPKSVGSHASGIIKLIREGHEGVELSKEEFIRVATWVDANAQYYGTYFGRKNLEYEGHPNFRPVPTFEMAISTMTPFVDEINR